MSRFFRTTAITLGAALAIFVPGTAFADPVAPPPSAEPDSLVREGVELRRNGHDAKALDAFRRAYALRPSARIRAQIGLAEEAVGDWLNAEQDLAAACAESDPWIQHNAEPLQAALRDVRGHLCNLEVEANVAGAEVWINDSLSGRLPLTSPLRVIAGTVKLSVRAAGHEQVDQVLSLPAGAELRESITLRPILLPASQAATRPPAATEGPPQPAPFTLWPPVMSTSTTEAPSPPRDHTLGWALAGTSGALLAGAVVATVVADDNAAIYNDDARCLYGTLTRDERCGPYRDRAQAADALAIGGYVLGAAAGVASIVTFLLPARSQEPSHQGEAVRCTFSGTSLGCGGSF